MQALVVPQRGRLELAEIPEPMPGPYQALVKIECCGICGSTDWKIVDGQMPWAGPFPLMLGHESVGCVVRVGSRVRTFKVGDRVTRPVNPPDRARHLNSAMGGFAEFGIVTDAAAMATDGDASLLNDYTALRQIVVPTGLRSVDASLAISLSETASALSALPNLRGRTVIVAGTGVAGLSFTLWATLAGASVLALGRRPERLAAARSLGAAAAFDTHAPDWLDRVLAAAHGPADGVIDAIGDVEFAAPLLKLIQPGGFACAYGAPAGGRSYPAGWTTACVEEHRAFAWVADLLLRGWVRPEWFVTHTWSLTEAPLAFDLVRRGEVLKGLVLMR